MNNEHTFALFREPGTTGGTALKSPNGSAPGVDPRIAAALSELEQARIRPMTKRDANRTVGVLSRIQSVATSLMCDVTAMLAAADTDTDPAEVLRHAGRLPTRESKRMAKMAKQLSEMPKVRERFSKGDITPSHVNALANAAEKVGPEAVDADESLLDAVDQLSSDSFDRHTRKWSDQKLIEEGADPLEGQRQAREAKLWVDKDTELGMLIAKFPAPQFQHLQQAVDNHYMAHLRQDSTASHNPDEVRTPKQRLADVIYELITNRNAVTGEFITEHVGIKAKASTQVILTAPIGVIDGTNPDRPVEMIGVGPVPRRILGTLTPDTELAAIIYDRAGRPLWLGRNQRLANAPQRLAVAVRDGGCFECGAPMHRCELHHIKEWHRDQGPTDVDNTHTGWCPVSWGAAAIVGAAPWTGGRV